MKFFLMFLVLVQIGLAERVMEARAYLATWDYTYEPIGGGAVKQGSRVDLSKFERLEKAPFESRFFNEGDELVDLTEWGVEMFFVEGLGDQMIWNETTGRLVVLTDRLGHREMVRDFRSYLEVKCEFEVRVLRVNGVTIADRGIREVDLPEEVEEIGKISGGLTAGELNEVETEDGLLSVEMEGMWGSEVLLWGCAVKIRSKIKGAKFEFQGGWYGLFGEPLVIEIGSVGKKQSVLIEVTLRGVLKDHVALRDWVWSEDGKEGWWEDAVHELVGPWKDSDYEGPSVKRRFTVPPTFLTFLSPGEEDPFGGERDPMSLLKSNGVPFRKGDSVVFLEESSTLMVVASPLAMELIDGIVFAGSRDAIGMIRQSFVMVESREKLTAENLAAGEYQIRKKVSHCLLPGQMSSIKFEGISLEGETQVDWSDSIVGNRYTLKSRTGGEVKSGGEIEAGFPMIVQQVKVMKKWRAWVLTVSVLRAKDYVDLK